MRQKRTLRKIRERNKVISKRQNREQIEIKYLDGRSQTKYVLKYIYGKLTKSGIYSRDFQIKLFFHSKICFFSKTKLK